MSHRQTENLGGSGILHLHPRARPAAIPSAASFYVPAHRRVSKRSSFKYEGMTHHIDIANRLILQFSFLTATVFFTAVSVFGSRSGRWSRTCSSRRGLTRSRLGLDFVRFTLAAAFLPLFTARRLLFFQLLPSPLSRLFPRLLPTRHPLQQELVILRLALLTKVMFGFRSFRIVGQAHAIIVLPRLAVVTADHVSLNVFLLFVLSTDASDDLFRFAGSRRGFGRRF